MSTLLWRFAGVNVLIDFLDASEGGTRGLADPDVLALGAATRRIVVSSDRKTMPDNFTRFLEANDSPGLIIIPQSVSIGRAVDELLLIWQDAQESELRNCVRWVRKHG